MPADHRDPTPSRLGRIAADGVGRAIAGAVALVNLRPAEKPMHPVGEVLLARLHRHGGSATGSSFLDEPGEYDVLVRFSRSVGLPAPWPDVNGLAVRVPTPHGPSAHADVLMSNTGQGPFTRYLLALSRRERGGFLGTLLPYRSPSGPVLVGARRRDEATWDLVWAGPRTPWTVFGSLELTDEPARDLSLSFDAVGAAPPGLEVPDWQRRVRGPSYARSRRARDTVSPHDLPVGAQSSTTMSSPRLST